MAFVILSPPTTSRGTPYNPIMALNTGDQQTAFSIQIENFNGEPDKLEWFIQQITDLKQINKWSDEMTFLFLKSKLTGFALFWYASNPTCKNITTFDEAVTQLRAFFRNDSTPLSNSAELHNIQLMPGKENTLADFLSRFPVNRTEISNTPQDEQELILPVVETHCNTINATSDTSLEISTSTWLKEQADDTQIIQLLKNLSLKDSNNIRDFYIDPTTQILMFKSHRKSQAELIVVPKSLQHKALDICHISHTGLDKTYQIVSNRYYWKGVYIDTKNFVLSCEQCIKNKSFTPKHAPPQSNRIPTRPGDYISVDIKGPLPNSGYVLTVLDNFSKHIVLYSLKNITAETVSKHILNYISIHGRPSQILSDRGLQFTSEVFSLINKTLGIKLNHTSPFHPQTNGQTERLNPAIESSILTLQERGVNLQNALLIHQNIYNGLIHPSNGYTPNLLHFGRNLPLIFDTFDNNSEPLFLDKAHYLQDLLQQLNTAYELEYSTLTRKQVEQNNRLAKNSRPRALHVGDIVYLKSKGALRQDLRTLYNYCKERRS
ncbi:Uncharacterized protein K02A2.6 [Araneus ventricosus]|uniref:RNA-directed DNA polymerase n=1 Tax=Araneus ventricosus TaxID=182803 RepID=A0A4Y2WPE5_ARAVE|nr:Uncharacterized protein K02A2.6 [Araneus ventricosus]